MHKISPTHPDASSYWYEDVNHNGESPFIPNGATWKVFRNVVTDYGADNTGATDATQSIIKAITGLSLSARSEALTHNKSARWLHIGFRPYQQQPGHYRPTSGCVFPRWHIYH